MVCRLLLQEYLFNYKSDKYLRFADQLYNTKFWIRFADKPNLKAIYNYEVHYHAYRLLTFRNSQIFIDYFMFLLLQYSFYLCDDVIMMRYIIHALYY